MIEFGCRKRHRDGTPIVKDIEVIEYAEALRQTENVSTVTQRLECWWIFLMQHRHEP